MKIAVIGAKGFLGRSLCQHLESNGHELDRYSSSDGKTFNTESGLLNTDFCLENDTDCVIYLSQSPYHRQLPEQIENVWNVNTISAMKVALNAKKSGVKRFIYTSTGNVIKPSFSALKETDQLNRDDWYSLSKIHAEEALSLFRNDMEINIARLFTLYGPGQKDRLIPNLVNRIKKNNPVILEQNPMEKNDKDGLVLSLCHVSDAANIISKVAQNGGPPCLLISSNEFFSIRDISLAIGNLIGIEPIFKESNRYRNGNLVADTSLLSTFINHDFIPFENGLKSVV